MSAALFCLGIALTFVIMWLGVAVSVAVAVFWFLPDRRVERQLAGAATASSPERPRPLDSD